MPQHNPEREEYDGEDTGPYDHTKYAQCDYIITRKEHFHTIVDCESQINKTKNTDHYPLMCALKTNMKIQGERKQTENHSAKIQKAIRKTMHGIQQKHIRSALRGKNYE